MYRQLVEDALSQLRGAALLKTGRGADLQWFSFRDQENQTIALHVQCPWRLVAGEEILVARADWWLPARPDIDVRNLDDDIGTRLRDVGNDRVCALLGAGTQVTSLTGDAFGGFEMEFENGWTLSCFADATATAHEFWEYWRVFIKGDLSSHVVVGNNGLLRKEEI